MDEYIPQLTLTPDLNAQPQPEVKKEDDLITKAQAAPEAGPDLSALSEQEQRVVCLIAIRCSPLQMSVLMVCGKSNISNLRRRLYRKLTGKEGSGADLDRLVIKLCS